MCPYFDKNVLLCMATHALVLLGDWKEASFVNHPTAGPGHTLRRLRMIFALVSKDTDFCIKLHQYQTALLPLPWSLKAVLAQVLAHLNTAGSVISNQSIFLSCRLQVLVRWYILCASHPGRGCGLDGMLEYKMVRFSKYSQSNNRYIVGKN